MNPKLIVIRHSERLDDVDEVAWRKLVLKNKSEGGRQCFVNDPVISSSDGPKIATEMAQTIKNIMKQSYSTEVTVRLYASRLLRAVQTASFIAREMNIPIHVSSGLANIIPAVKSKKGSFEFAALRELSRYCSSVEFVDCDNVRSANYLQTDGWRTALDTILAKSSGQNVVNIVVTHREMVRKLAGESIPTPYCCVGLFAVPEDPHEVQHGVQKSGFDATEQEQSLSESKDCNSQDRITQSMKDSSKEVTGSKRSSDEVDSSVSTQHHYEAEKQLKVVNTTSSKGSVNTTRSGVKVNSTEKSLSAMTSRKVKNVCVGSSSKITPKIYTFLNSIEFVSVLDRDGTMLS